MKLRTEIHYLELNYIEGVSCPESGYYEGGVKDPDYQKELRIWVDEEQIFDFDSDAFVSSGRYQIHIDGTKRAMYELGKYLVALSMYETDNKQYHEHLEELCELSNKNPCEIVAHLPRIETD